MELKDFLLWVSTIGAGTISYEMMEHVAWLAARPTQGKRWWAFGIAGLVAMLGFLAAVGLGYRVAPVGATAWCESLFAVATTAFGLGQLIHGQVVLRARAVNRVN
jgi:hypothetical protein